MMKLSKLGSSFTRCAVWGTIIQEQRSIADIAACWKKSAPMWKMRWGQWQATGKAIAQQIKMTEKWTKIWWKGVLESGQDDVQVVEDNNRYNKGSEEQKAPQPSEVRDDEPKRTGIIGPKVREQVREPPPGCDFGSAIFCPDTREADGMYHCPWPDCKACKPKRRQEGFVPPHV